MSEEVQLIQRIVQDLNNVRTQLQTSRSQIGEITTTLEILADQPDEHAVKLDALEKQLVADYERISAQIESS